MKWKVVIVNVKIKVVVNINQGEKFPTKVKRLEFKKKCVAYFRLMLAIVTSDILRLINLSYRERLFVCRIKADEKFIFSPGCCSSECFHVTYCEKWWVMTEDRLWRFTKNFRVRLP